MIHLYKDELMSFEEIGKCLSIDWWIVKQLFNKHRIPRITTKERAMLKRKKVFPLIYKLHFEHNLSFAEIYKKHGFRPAYSKLVLSEGNCEDNKIDLASD